MRNYIIRRLILLPITLLMASFIIFFSMNVLPGNVARYILGTRGSGAYTTAQYDQLKAQLGLDQGFAHRFGSWLWNALQLKFGKSLVTNESVGSQIATHLPVTLELAVLAWLLSVLIGLPLGTVMALHKDRFLDYVGRAISTLALGISFFVLASITLTVLAVDFHWNPPVGVDPFESLSTNLRMMAIPAATNAVYCVGLTARLMRSGLIDVMGQDYMRTAQAKGVPMGLAIWRHALKNALIPVITISGYLFGILIGGALVTELIFGIPGMGQLLFTAVESRDYPVVQACALLAVAGFLLSTLLVDIAYAYVNPRIRYDGA